MADAVLAVRVRYHEVDRMGFVHHTRFLTWFECARMLLLRGAGAPYDELEAAGVGLPIRRVEVRHHRAVRYDEWVRVEVTLAARRGAGLTLAYRALVGEELAAEGETEHAAVRLPEGRVTRLPPELVAALERLPSQGGDLPPAEEHDPASCELGSP